MIVTKDNMFYINCGKVDKNETGQLCKTNLNGKNKLILTKNVDKFAVSEGFIYYTDFNDNDNLYKMDFNGNNQIKLIDQRIENLDVDGEYIYYSTEGDGTYRMNKDGSGMTMIIPDTGWGLNVYKGYLYYINHTQGGISRLNLETNVSEHIINQGYVGSINITGEHLYFDNPSGTSIGGWYRSNLDGSDVQKWMAE